MTTTQPGDVTTIGPECFAAADGSVISWKGENYYRATNLPEAIQGTVELAGDSMIVPLRQAARDRRNQSVKLHVDVGGQTGVIQVDGRLTRFDEDDMVVTLADNAGEFDVPLHRIVLIESPR